MTTDPNRDASLTREERLAAKLRENLRRRKAQARKVAAAGSDSSTDAVQLPNPLLPNGGEDS